MLRFRFSLIPVLMAAVLSAPATVQAVMDHMTHESHQPREIPAGHAVPNLSLRLYTDAVSGFNLELITTHFQLGPPRPAGDGDLSVTNGVVAGHAHLYVNGEKIGRLYGPHTHLPASLFKPGVNQVTVSLNSHNHQDWSAGGRQILATLFIDPAAAEPIKHRFESFPAVGVLITQ